MSAEDPVVVRRLTAFHEAGHAVIGLRYNFKLVSATIVSGEKHSGVCFWDGDPTGVEGIEVYAAGSAAEDHSGASELLSDASPWKFPDCDQTKMMELALHLLGADDESAAREKYISPAQDRVSQALQSQSLQRELVAVAQALLEHGTLTGDQVAAIVEGEVEMIRRYRWKRGQLGDRPSGIEIDKCYAGANHTHEPGTKAHEYDLLADEDRVVARKIPLSCLEECVENTQ